MEVNSSGSCLCMVNREHFWKVMVAGEGGGGEGKIGQLSPYPLHCADLELMLDQAFVYIFPVHFSTVYTSCLRPRRDTFGVTDVRSTPEVEGKNWKWLGQRLTLFVKLHVQACFSPDLKEQILYLLQFYVIKFNTTIYKCEVSLNLFISSSPDNMFSTWTNEGVCLPWKQQWLNSKKGFEM